ncbi:hypothetical protein B0H17DRAFT_1329889 [Mycena rosella]|uniref:Uncharacterized protein n=1 Tax=Mycena rosella TaxID=1033263 RepID=A0AAD7DMH1_MYCRO|nr:hypothetical protein B0H17DRAFT_1329889 [Mycena rosella]
MSPFRYLLTARAASTSNAASATDSSSTDSYSPRTHTIPAFLPWVLATLFLLFMMSTVLLCCPRRKVNLSIPARPRNNSPRRTASIEKHRGSREMLLHPELEKEPSMLCTPAPAYTAAGDNVAPGQEDAVFHTSREQRRALYVLYKPLVPTPPKFRW